MMIPILIKCSLSDIQYSSSVRELSNEEDYAREVLLFADGESEDAADEQLMNDAEALGIKITQPPTASQKTLLSECDSPFTVNSGLGRSGSTASRVSNSTSATSSPRTSVDPDVDGGLYSLRRRQSPKRSLSFSEYDKFAAQYEAQQSASKTPLTPTTTKQASSLFSVSTKSTRLRITTGLKKQLKRTMSRTKHPKGNTTFCVCCREEFKSRRTLHTLACGHKYCDTCLRVLTTQAVQDESKMPPKCCTFALPSTIIIAVLLPNEQESFLKAVHQYATPWEERIFCPKHTCSEFIPKRKRIDPRHPFEVVCPKCYTKVCSTCKRQAHKIGQDCPADFELDAVLEMGEKRGWKRCYKCRNLVELTQGCSHITCRCKAQFCYICGAIWDTEIGCPNFCNGEEELERRRLEEEQRAAAYAAARAAQEAAEAASASENLESKKRSEDNEEVRKLRIGQIEERDRFIAYERKIRWLMWTRHGQQKIDLLERYSDLQQKMKERHSKTYSHLEDRQVTAEWEFRGTLKQAERSVRIRLKHMEAYCDGLGREATGSNPARTVTERDLRELGNQYTLRDDLERTHQSKINVMREKQGKQMEQLLGRQEEEMHRLAIKQAEELESLEDGFVVEEDSFHAMFSARRERLGRRWIIAEEVLRKRLEISLGGRFGPLDKVEWCGTLVVRKVTGLPEDYLASVIE